MSSTFKAGDTVIGNRGYILAQKDYYRTTKVMTINAVPLQWRYNINKYVGAGVGSLVSLDLYQKNKHELDYKFSANAAGVAIPDLKVLANETKKNFADARVSFFADVQLGLVRVGPSIGFRYLYDAKTKNSRMATYVTWKF